MSASSLHALAAVIEALPDPRSKKLIMPEFVAAAFACNLGIGLARIGQKGHDLPCFCETKK